MGATGSVGTPNRAAVRRAGTCLPNPRLINTVESRQVAVLKRIHELLDSSAPQHFIYETLQGHKVQVIRAGGDRRIYCTLVSKHLRAIFALETKPIRFPPRSNS